MEEGQTYERWDIKKILAALVLSVVVALSFKTFVLDQKSPESSNNRSINVKGENTSQVPSFSPTSAPAEEIKKGIENKLIELNKEANNINVVEIATSTPTVKKILNDLRNLQNLPQSSAKEACFKICNGI